MGIGHRQRYQRLLDHYGPQHWWPADSILEMLIGAILTQNTNWNNVEKSLANLRSIMQAGTLAQLPEEELAERIRPSGFNRIKTKRIKAFLNWYRNYDYDPEIVRKKNGVQVRRELLNVHGIGPETADAMLVYAFNKPFFIADRYAMRFFSRMGDSIPKNYEWLRKEVESELPNELGVYKDYHALIVAHAKAHCRATPMCKNCPLFSVCARTF